MIETSLQLWWGFLFGCFFLSSQLSSFFCQQRSRNVGKYSLHIIFIRNFPWQPKATMHFYLFCEILHAQIKIAFACLCICSLNSVCGFFARYFMNHHRMALVVSFLCRWCFCIAEKGEKHLYCVNLFRSQKIGQLSLARLKILRIQIE